MDDWQKALFGDGLLALVVVAIAAAGDVTRSRKLSDSIDQLR